MNEAAFYSAVRTSLFGRMSQAQVDGISGIIKAMDEVGDGDRDTLAYALATAFHETGKRMVPVREGFAKTDAGARKAVANLAEKRGPNSAPARYGKPAGPFGQVYYGRGHVQLTWLKNYQNSSADAGVDLVRTPDAMLDPIISARVLIRGIMDGRWNGQGKGIAQYEGADDKLSDTEAEDARRLVNVKDKAKLIAGYYRKFYDALTKAGWAAAPHVREAPKTEHEPPVMSKTAPVSDINPAAQPSPAKGGGWLKGLFTGGALAGGGWVAAKWDAVTQGWADFWLWAFSFIN